jgi:hypothetical protein
MSVAVDRSCPNCGKITGVAKVSALYHKAQAADGNIEGMSQRQDGYRRYGRGAVIDRPKSEMAQKMSPPLKPTTTLNANSSFFGAAGGSVVAAALMSFALTFIFGGGSMTATLPLLFLIFMVGSTVYVQRKRVEAFKKIPFWEKAMDRWDEMYYCANCDGLYIPWERKFVPAAQMQALAYQDAALKPDMAKQAA